MHIIFESVPMPFTQNYQNQTMLVDITACQSWIVFSRHSVQQYGDWYTGEWWVGDGNVDWSDHRL